MKTKKKHKNFSNIDYIKSDVMEIDFPDNSFDLIYAGGIFLCLEDEELEILSRKLRRWVDQEGYLFVRDFFFPRRYECTLEKHGEISVLRPIEYYEKLFKDSFTLLKDGSLEATIKLCADPFRCFWLFRKNFIERRNK